MAEYSGRLKLEGDEMCFIDSPYDDEQDDDDSDYCHDCGEDTCCCDLYHK